MAARPARSVDNSPPSIPDRRLAGPNGSAGRAVSYRGGVSSPRPTLRAPLTAWRRVALARGLGAPAGLGVPHPRPLLAGACGRGGPVRSRARRLLAPRSRPRTRQRTGLLPADAVLVRRLRRRPALGRPVRPAGPLRRGHDRRDCRRAAPAAGHAASAAGVCRRARLLGAAGDRALPHPVRRLPVGPAGVQPGRQPALAPGRLRRRPGGDGRGGGARGPPARSGRGDAPSGSGSGGAGPRHRWPATRHTASAGALAALALAPAVAALVLSPPTDGRRVSVMFVQGNVPRPGLDFNAERRRVLDNHVQETLRGVAAAKEPPGLVVWPENSSDIDPLRNPDADAAIRSAVEGAGAPVLVGAVLREPAPKISNVSLMYRPGGGDPERYVKQHPVPFAEYIPYRSFFRNFSDKVDLVTADFAAGDRPGAFEVPTASGPLLLGHPHHLLRGGLRRPDARGHAAARQDRQPARGADQQRHLRLHRRVGAAVRHLPAASDRARALRSSTSPPSGSAPSSTRTAPTRTRRRSSRLRPSRASRSSARR